MQSRNGGFNLLLLPEYGVPPSPFSGVGQVDLGVPSARAGTECKKLLKCKMTVQRPVPQFPEQLRRCLGSSAKLERMVTTAMQNAEGFGLE